MQRVNVLKTFLPYDYSRLENRKATNKIVIHHTGNPTDTDWDAKTINNTHQNKGWVCIGYHYVVRKDGSIEEGRPHWVKGSHALNHNWDSIGIHVSGNFEIAEPTPEQIESLAMLIGTVCHDYGIPINEETVVAHRDLMATACCGENLYKQLDIVRGKALWYQQN
ncbi:MAG: N-acetylmuramoyl-L-alanine amidase [Selenomonadales bacterium]|nr:N-acetylmuramoyl-L-alanine amidase [Selenomonadales bacterium]